MAKRDTSDPETYTDPALRERLKKKIVAGDKGGHRGQWSARKAQLLTQEYERAGGGYKKARNTAQKSLRQWGDEHWTTSDGGPARRKGVTKRYLPEKAWEQLTPAEKVSTNRKKIKGSRRGKQFVSNTQPAAKARKQAAAKKTITKRCSTTPRPRSPKRAGVKKTAVRKRSTPAGSR